MGRWAQAHRRGSVVSLNAAPGMSLVGEGDLSWYWPLVDPYAWQFDVSVDGGATWTIGAKHTAGNNRYKDSFDPGMWRMYGVDAGYAPVTGTSNVIIVV
jgi:hypothetical protein